MLVETPNLRFAIDGRMLDRDGTGVSTYARAMRDALTLLGRTPEALRDAHCTPHHQPKTRGERWWRWSETCLDSPRWLWRRRMYARDIYRLAQVHFDRHDTLLRFHPRGNGVIHWTYPVPIVFAGWTNIYTVHDAIPLTHPQLTSIDPARHRRLLERISERAAKILTVSEAARHDILQSIDLREDHVVACPTGLAVEAPAAELPDGLVPGRYVLALGSVEPRKNLLPLAEAHAASAIDMPLVVAGPAGWHGDAIDAALADRPGIIRLPYVSRATLLRVIADARALLFPTLAEGFGLPIVEAMHLGTAVMTSQGGATEEIAGSAALLVDPHSMDSMVAAITRLAQDDMLVGTLAEAGHLRAADYSLPAFAARIDAVHRQLA